MVQEPSEASDSGNSRSCSSAARCTCASVTPASTIMQLAARSMSRMRFSRTSDRITCWPVGSGICPPTSPVLPPCGTKPMFCAWHSRRIAATSAVLPGCTTARARPWKSPRGSLRWGARSAGAVRTWAAPVIFASCLIRVMTKRRACVLRRRGARTRQPFPHAANSETGQSASRCQACSRRRSGFSHPGKSSGHCTTRR